MKLSADIHDDVTAAFMSACGPNGLATIHSAVGEGLVGLISSYIRKIAPKHHHTASRLSATPTGYLEEAGRGTTMTSSADGAVIDIPSAGMARAFHDLTIKPKKARALTIPLSAVAYGRRASELTGLGWTIFNPPGTPFLFGAAEGDDEPQLLYKLVGGVRVPQDRSLLPSNEDIVDTAKNAIIQTVKGVVEKARRLGL